MIDPKARVTISLMGTFRVCSFDGIDLTPRAGKAQALLALLACARDMQRSRIWLQDHLWSDRGHAQGSASLRQVLTDIRKSFGAHAACFDTGRKSIGLLDCAIDETADNQEFLEGIDVRDPEFESWLQIERARRTGYAAGQNEFPHPQLGATRLVISRNMNNDDTGTFMSDLMTSTIAQSILESLDIETVAGTPKQTGNDALFLSVRSILQKQSATIRVTWEHGQQRRFVWSGTRLMATEGMPPADHLDFLQLANEAVEVLAETILRENTRLRGPQLADSLGRKAIRQVFSMDSSVFASADQLLCDAFDLDPRGVFPAWRSLLRMIQSIERHDNLSDGVDDQAVELAAKAMELDPLNSLVLAAAANTKLLIEGQVEGGCDLAERAVRINPANPFAWDALSTAALHFGRLEQAHTYALKAQRIGANSPFKHWWDMGCCLTATVTGNLELARQFAMTAHALSPGFRPPLRYLIALNAAKDQLSDARRAIQKLKRVETGFSTDTMLSDGNYPVAALRKADLNLADLNSRLS